jgi:ATP-binding cassette subfamily F protein 3
VITLSGVSKQFGSKILLNEASAFIGARSRIALLGPNGSGKTTLLKMILGLEAPDTGAVSRAKHLLIGHLAQEVPSSSGRTVLEETMRLGGRREELLAAKRELEEHFERNVDEGKAGGHESDLDRYGRILEELEHLDEYRLESRAKEILSGMGFKPGDFERPLSSFSGGWLMRVALSRVLLMDPDLRLLDEPTNHLDLESLLWLEEFLGSHQGAMLLVSHDRAFLNRVATEVLEIDGRGLETYRGNIDAWVTQKAERLEVLRARRAGQEARIAELESFIDRFGAKATKARQAQSRQKMLDRIESELVDLPEARARVRFRFPPAPHSGKDVIIAEHAQVRYGEKCVFRDLNLVLRKGTRVAIAGVNGAGKTTLLKLLAGTLAPTAGVVRPGHQAMIGYYAQHQAEALDLDRTVLQELAAAAPEAHLPQLRAIAGAFLFSGDAVEKKCRVLSGGEKARVALAKLLLTPSNVLLLDEPTNHLDIESREVLLEALLAYEGTLCLVSHDREFIGQLVDTVLDIEPGPAGSTVVPLLGGYEDYLARKSKEAREAARASKATEPSPARPDSAPAVPKGPSNNQKRSWERERDKLEGEIARHEKRLAELSSLLGDQATYEDKARMLTLLEEQRVLSGEINTKLKRWEELCLQLQDT